MANEQKALATRTLEYGEYKLPIAKLNDDVRFTLMQRTFAHIMQNEASAVHTRLAAQKDEDGEPKYGDAELATLVHDWRNEKLAAMIKGEFSLRQVGPKLTPDETQLRDIAKAIIVAQCTATKTPMPKASDKESWDTAIEEFLETKELRAMADAELARRKAFVAPKASTPDMAGLFAKKKAA